MNGHFDVAVVGGGIVGLAHAWTAARNGQRVALFERSDRAQGASVRNFGMIWPIGQPAGELRDLAMRSQELWLQLADEAGIKVNHCGSVHLARHADELAVLEEFAAIESSFAGAPRLCSADETAAMSPAIRREGLLGGLWSNSELCVNPRAVIGSLPGFLAERLGVSLHYATAVVSVDSGIVTAANGETWSTDRIVICSGSDFRTLLPDAFAGAGIRLCKLHMMKTGPQPDAWRQGPHIAGGLTLRHYTSFETCPSLSQVKKRVSETAPELDRYGIHVMSAQNEVGEVILGDSHEYDADILPFDRTEIDELILRELHQLITLPSWKITERWHGIYAKWPDGPLFESEPISGVHVSVAPGGAGMTMSFGLADRAWSRWNARNAG